MQITSRDSWTCRTLRVWLGCSAFLTFVAGAQGQTYYYYYPTQTTPTYYTPATYQGQTVWYDYSTQQYYQTANSTPVYQTGYNTQYYQTAQYETTVQTATYAQPVQEANATTVAQTTEGSTTTVAQTTEGNTVTPQPEQVMVPVGDPYGFLNWLNATRAAYGLSVVGYDPNLSSWAAMNNNQQAASGIGHFVMGPARRQNSAMGGFPGIESMWMASPAHRAALLDPTIRWVGIAALGAYWTFNAN